MTILFTNPGELDLRAITTFGLNAKPETNSPIGYFGTGLKYAMAICAREGIAVVIQSGLARYTLTTAAADFRGEAFQQIQLEPESGPPIPLPFTTTLGQTWSLWQAYRELYANALDEDGKIGQEPDKAELPAPHPSTTTICLSGDKIDQVHQDRAQFILQSSPINSTDELEIHPGQARGIFYRGFLVSTLLAPTHYTYNLTSHQTLTEDRTLRYEYTARATIVEHLARLTDTAIIRKLLTGGKDFLEYDFAWSTVDIATECSPEFLSVAAAVASDHINVPDGIRQLIYKRANTDTIYTQIQPTACQSQSLERASQLLSDAGLYSPRFPIKLVKELGPGVLGMAQMKEREIYLAQEAFNQGTKCVAATLYEEYIHLDKNLNDFSRAFQNHTINALLNVVEEHQGKLF